MTAPSPTASQTIGPFFRFGMAWAATGELVDPATPGAIIIEGRVLDGDGAPVPDAMVEIWQADAEGRFPPATGSGWRGFGRALTDGSGAFRFVTVAPGAVDGEQAPHIDVSVFARGLLQRVVTRCYPPGDADALAGDPLLASIADADRRATLIAVPTGGETSDSGGVRRPGTTADATGTPGAGALRFDIHLQGDRETVFLDW